MSTTHFIAAVLLITHNLLNCASAAVHGHNTDLNERESDGAYRPKDSGHYGDSGHNVEFDHEAILGSVKLAETYDKLQPEESRRRLSKLVPRMDLNNDKFIDRTELTKWILNSFINLSREEADERLLDADGNEDGVVTWVEYIHDTFGVDTEEEIDSEDTGDSGLLVHEEKAMWMVADSNGDGVLDAKEFAVFNAPEEHASMHPFLVQQTLREKDADRDGRIDFKEYLGERGIQQDKAWLVAERDKFEHELDTNGDGTLDEREIHAWVIPDNNEIAEEEVDHLFAAADDDHDGRLSYDEILDHHDVFVGSEAAGYGDALGEHFDDEL